MWTAALRLLVSAPPRKVLETWIRAPGTLLSVVTRSRIILLASQGCSNNRIARQLGISRSPVILWRERFGVGGPVALTEIQDGRGRRPKLSARKIKQIVEATRNPKPEGGTHVGFGHLAGEVVPTMPTHRRRGSDGAPLCQQL